MKRLVLSIATISLFSCATAPQIIEKEVFVKCPVPDIPKTKKPKVNPNASYPEKLKSLLDYLFELEKENELLRTALEMCK